VASDGWAVSACVLRGRPAPVQEPRRRTGLAPNTPSTRLSDLTEAVLPDREAFDGIPPRVEYTPTAKAEALLPVLGNVAGSAVNRGIPGISSETYLVPAITIQVALAAAITSSIGLVNDIENGMFETVLDSLPSWVQTFASYNPVTYGVDAARSLMLDRDVTTVLDVTAFSGPLDGVIPGVAVLLALDVVLGAVTLFVLSRASSSKAR
jgi:DNA-binding HxlR family transcriptional regulator